MTEQIKEALATLERQHNSRILFAVESGSRAWGFASPDSDYDVRAVYVKPLDWYLGLEEGAPDTWTEALPGDLDISAWELRKALRQLLKSNASFLEWIGSPIVYSDSGILGTLSGFAGRAFHPEHVAFHYASMFRHAMEDRTPDGLIGVKKLCYALRASVAVQWIQERGTMPPTEFAQALDGVTIAGATRQAIDGLLLLKSRASEKDRISPDTALAPLLVDRLAEVSGTKWRATAEETPVLRTELEALFREEVYQDRDIRPVFN